MLRQAKNTFTLAEFLAMEVISEEKHEYYNGKISEMASATADQSIVSVNCAVELNKYLAPMPAHIFGSGMRLLVERSGFYTYPKAMVVPGKLEFARSRNDVITNPILIVEVLSESTRKYDRDAKFNFYKQIPSLREYILVESEQARVECYRRTRDDQWVIEMYEDLDTVVKLESVACEIPLRQIYAKVSWLS